MAADPAFLMLTQEHREAVAGLTYALLERKGMVVVAGVAGAGKTTVLRWMLENAPAGTLHASFILNPTVSRSEFMDMVLVNFGITDCPQEKPRQLLRLHELLLEGRKQGKTLALIIDEAHKLSPELLEEVRLLGNFEYAGEKLLQIVLAGQPGLDDKLSSEELWQLRQRTAIHLKLQPLDSGEVEHYINHRWRVAGGKSPAPFQPPAIETVTTISKRVPRLVNSICDNALMLAFADDEKEVTAAHVRAASSDLGLLTIDDTQPEAPLRMVRPRGDETRMLAAVANDEAREAKKSFISRWAIRLRRSA